MPTPYRWGRASLALRIAAAAIIVINLLDAALTLIWTLSGLATEANPLMDVQLAYGPMRFMVTKLTLVSLGLLLLWRLRSVPLARIAILGSAAAYIVLLSYHLNEVPQLVALLS